MSQPGPPFAGRELVTVVPPSELDGLPPGERESLLGLAAAIRANRGALERELGARLELAERDPGTGARWLIGPARCNPDLARLRGPSAGPELALDRAAGLLICDAPSAAELWETLSWLRSLARVEGGALPIADCQDAADALRRIEAEVGDSYPSFDLRGLDWPAICAEQRPAILAAADPIPALQAWLARLGDTHTWVRAAQPLSRLPYEVWLTPGGARLAAVPPGSAGWEAGARPGCALLEPAGSGWWERTAASPHARPLVAGRRLLEGPPGERRDLAALSPAGSEIRWSETIPAAPWGEPASWTRLDSGAGYLRISAWTGAATLDDAIDAALGDFQGLDRLIVDLRGNGGGNQAQAMAFRDRFLPGPLALGSIRYSTGHRSLSAPEELRGEPAAGSRRWPGAVRFLTDPLTYSASEDALLGLQGLPRIQIVGEPSGGGSGRARMLRLLPGWRLTVSTALTYDRGGRCVEGAGIPVDLPVASDWFGGDPALRRAERDW